MSIWDSPEMQVADNFVSFDKVGDTVTGVVTAVLRHRFDDGSVAPQLLLDVNGETKTVTCGAIRLKAAMAEQRPEAGDQVSITLASEEPRGGGKTLRHWDVHVTRGVGTPPAQQQAPQQPPAWAVPDQGNVQAQQPPAAAPPQQVAPTPAAPAPAAQSGAVDQQAAAAALAALTPEQKAALGLS